MLLATKDGQWAECCVWSGLSLRSLQAAHCWGRRAVAIWRAPAAGDEERRGDTATGGNTAPPSQQAGPPPGGRGTGSLGGWGASPGAGVWRLWRVRAGVSGWISCNETKTGKALQWVTAAQPGRARAGAGAGRITTVS